MSKMSIIPYATVWRCLLAACRIHSNLQLRERVAEQFLALDPENFAPYVHLSNIYAAAGRLDDIEKEIDHTHKHGKFMQSWTYCLGR
eukprot:Gb_14749 [translate_table: standard]